MRFTIEPDGPFDAALRHLSMLRLGDYTARIIEKPGVQGGQVLVEFEATDRAAADAVLEAINTALPGSPWGVASGVTWRYTDKRL